MTDELKAVVRPAGDVPASQVKAGTATEVQVLVGPEQVTLVAAC